LKKLTVSQEIQLSQIYFHGKKRRLVKMPEIHKQTNSTDCGLYAIANAVECCLTGYTGGLHITLDQKYMRDHLISCLEKNQFRPFPKCFISKKSKVKSQNFIIETNCECGETDGITIWLGVNGQRELRHATHGNINHVQIPILLTHGIGVNTSHTDFVCFFFVFFYICNYYLIKLYLFLSYLHKGSHSFCCLFKF
jgi:hypothetical protein